MELLMACRKILFCPSGQRQYERLVRIYWPWVVPETEEGTDGKLSVKQYNKKSKVRVMEHIGYIFGNFLRNGKGGD